jgi:hypothetical protein
MCLKIANPERVFMVRGNHEDEKICSRYGFKNEFVQKFDNNRLFQKTMRMYDCLPVVLYIGVTDYNIGETNYLQCCHGGMEIGYSPRTLLAVTSPIAFEQITSLNRAAEFNTLVFAQEHSEKAKKAKRLFTDIIPQSFSDMGHMWSDFAVEKGTMCSYVHGRYLEFGEILTKTKLAKDSTKNNKIRGVLRAHQHGSPTTPMMQSILHNGLHNGISMIWQPFRSLWNQLIEMWTGYSSLWDTIVCTFLVAPDTPYSQAGNAFDYDAFGILHCAPRFQDWRLRVCKNSFTNIF